MVDGCGRSVPADLGAWVRGLWWWWLNALLGVGGAGPIFRAWFDRSRAPLCTSDVEKRGQERGDAVWWDVGRKSKRSLSLEPQNLKTLDRGGYGLGMFVVSIPASSTVPESLQSIAVYVNNNDESRLRITFYYAQKSTQVHRFISIVGHKQGNKLMRERGGGATCTRAF